MRKRFGVLVLLLSLTVCPSRAAAPPSPAVDASGDPLPDGAVARLGTLRWRTGDFVNGLTWSADGRWIASAENGGVARLWDATTGRPVCVFAGHREAVTSVAFSPDGKHLVTASRDSVRIWDSQTGIRLSTIQLRTRRGPRQEVPSAVFGSDGKTVVVFSRDEVIRLDSSNGKELNRFSLAAPAGHTLSPQGDRVAIYRERGTIQLHDTTSGDLIYRLAGQGGGGQPSFSAEGTLLGAKLGESAVILPRHVISSQFMGRHTGRRGVGSSG